MAKPSMCVRATALSLWPCRKTLTEDQFEIVYAIGAETVRSPNTRPLIHLFDESGACQVTGQYTHGNDIVTASVTVEVLDGAFPDESPACIINKRREWNFSGMPSNVVYEVDDSVKLTVLDATVSTNSTVQSSLLFTATVAHGNHAVVARTCPGGPIVASKKLDTCWIQNATDGYFWVVEEFEDSQLWEVESVQQYLPDTVEVRLKIIEARCAVR